MAMINAMITSISLYDPNLSREDSATLHDILRRLLLARDYRPVRPLQAGVRECLDEVFGADLSDESQGLG